MVVPGSLDFAIIRGIAFDSIILQCRDEKLDVTGSLTPDATGLYLPTLGYKFAGYDLFVLAGAPTWFIYFNPTLANWVIASTLTTGGLSNYWINSLSPGDDPSGVFSPAGTYTGSPTVSDNPTDLTGYAAEAVVRRTEKTGAEIVLDLEPFVSNATAGEITIPAISKDDTFDLDNVGNFRWDLVLRLISTGERFGPFAKGRFIISDNITQFVPP